MKLQRELSDSESQIAAARRSYNAMIQSNNTMVELFPAALIARWFGFCTHEFFNVDTEREALDQRPTAKF